MMRIFYAGDGPADGAARYLLGVLKHLRATVRHVPPTRCLRPGELKGKWDLIILSDLPARLAPPRAQAVIRQQVEAGAGLLMVGGWASFSGPFGGWRGSIVEELLPVKCLGRDDRTNFPGGALIAPLEHHALLQRINFEHPPFICGLNQVLPRQDSLVLLDARRVTCRTLPTGVHLLTVDTLSHPLLVIDANPARHVAAMTTDLAPHWCGGLVDWGSRTRRITVKPGVQIEVGIAYIELIETIVAWLAGGRRK